MGIRNGLVDGWRGFDADRRRRTILAAAAFLISAGLFVTIYGSVVGALAFALRFAAIGLVVYLVVALILRISDGPSAFDGAGKEFHGPSARAAILIVLAVVLAIAVNWVGNGWLLDQVFGTVPSASPVVQVPGLQ